MQTTEQPAARLKDLEDFDASTQAWILSQVQDDSPCSDEFATHIARLFFPDEDFILVTERTDRSR